jgi:hypothetical protein
MKNIYLIIIMCILTSSWLYAKDPTTVASGTWWFQGSLTATSTGYTGTIPAIDDSSVGDGESGFDVYARNGAWATYDKVGSGQDYETGIVSGHDAYNTGGGWGSFYNPDVADWYNYQLTLNGMFWKVEYISSGITRAAPMSGRINWDRRSVSETGTGVYYSSTAGIAESPGYAAQFAADHGQSTSGAWDMDWSWGSEYIPLQGPFGITVRDQGGGQYLISIQPVIPPTCSAYKERLLTDTSVALVGSMLKDGGMNCEYRFVYWEDCGEPMATDWTGHVAEVPLSQILTAEIEGLKSATLYNFQMEVRNSAGVGQSAARQFRTLPCLSGITYIDATEGEYGNTALAAGGVFEAPDSGSGVDNLWSRLTFGTNGTIFESGGDFGSGNTEDCPRLVTTVEVPENDYAVYAYFWSDTSQWRISASLTDDEELPLFIADPTIEADANDFGDCVVPMLTEDDLILYQAFLGNTGPTTIIQVFIDDQAAHLQENYRTWYDGIGYQALQ